MPVYTEIKRITIENACQKGVFLRWLNQLGGYEQYYFSGEWVKSVDVEDTKSFRSDYGRRTQVLKKSTFEKILIRSGNLTPQQAEGISTLVHSQSVYMEKDGGLYPVLVNGSSFQVFDTEQGGQKAQFEVLIKRRNSQIG